MAATFPDGYSANIEMWLETTRGRFDVAQVCNNLIVLAKECILSVGESGRLVIRVDGEEEASGICVCRVDGAEVTYI